MSAMNSDPALKQLHQCFPFVQPVRVGSRCIDSLGHSGLPRRIVAYLIGVGKIFALIGKGNPACAQTGAIAMLGGTPRSRLSHRRRLGLVDSVDQASELFRGLLYVIPVHVRLLLERRHMNFRPLSGVSRFRGVSYFTHDYKIRPIRPRW